MTQLTTLAAQYATLIYLALALGLLTAIYVAFRFQINFWWMNCWYSLPLIGKLVRLSRDTSRGSNPGWLRAEETLCADYRKYIMATSEPEFRRRLVYLRKAQDLGRKPLPGWMIVVLIVLLIAEGLGFAYLLGTWLARDGSANVHTVLMLGIVLVMCIIMMFLTHAAGDELYRTGLIRRCEKEWRDGGQQSDLRTEDVMLYDDQARDDHVPGYAQTMNRVGTNGGYAMVGVAVAAIALIACGSTWMRVSNLNQEMLQSTALTANSDPFAANGIPAELTEPQRAADQKARAEALEEEKSEGWAAFIMLAVIFVFTQIVGIYTGYRYGFAGKQSGDAYRGTRGFSPYGDYLDHIDPIRHVSQAKLGTLQSKLAARSGVKNLNLHKTFDDYLHEVEARRLALQQAVVSPAGPAPISSLEEVVQRLERLSSAAEKKALVAALPAALKADVIRHLKAEKVRQEAAAAVALDKDLEGLF